MANDTAGGVDGTDSRVVQQQLDGNQTEIPELDCRLYGEFCDGTAEYLVSLSGNKYADGGDIVVCDDCLQELEEAEITNYRELSDQDLIQCDE